MRSGAHLKPCFSEKLNGPAASKGDWPRRIAAYARDEQEDAAAYADS